MNRADVLKLFHQFLGASEDKLKANSTNLAAFLIKASGLIDKISGHLLSHKSDPEELTTNKQRFIFWLFHRLLLIKSQVFDENLEICGRCDAILSQLLSLLAVKEPFTFRLVIQHLLVLIQGNRVQFLCFRALLF